MLADRRSIAAAADEGSRPILARSKLCHFPGSVRAGRLTAPHRAAWIARLGADCGFRPVHQLVLATAARPSAPLALGPATAVPARRVVRARCGGGVRRRPRRLLSSARRSLSRSRPGQVRSARRASSSATSRISSSLSSKSKISKFSSIRAGVDRLRESRCCSSWRCQRSTTCAGVRPCAGGDRRDRVVVEDPPAAERTPGLGQDSVLGRGSGAARPAGSAGAARPG